MRPSYPADIDVSFEQMFYQIPEESLTNNLALYICATVANVDLNDPATIMQFEQSPVKVSAQTVSITAEGEILFWYKAIVSKLRAKYSKGPHTSKVHENYWGEPERAKH